MVLPRIRISQTALFLFSVFSISFVLMTNLFMFDPKMETNDHAIHNEKGELSLHQFFHAKSNRELRSYNAHTRVQWFERLPKAHNMAAEQSENISKNEEDFDAAAMKSKERERNSKKNKHNWDKNIIRKHVKYGNILQPNTSMPKDGSDEETDDNNNESNYDLTENSVFKTQNFEKASGITLTGKPAPSRLSKDKTTDIQTELHVKDAANAAVNHSAYFGPLIIDKIFWSNYVENLVPKGQTHAEVISNLDFVKRQHVHSLQPPTWNRCGRPKNGLVILEDRSHWCARYRAPHNKLVLGEVLSFHLSRLLGMDNVPTVSLSQVNHTSPQWRGVNFTKLQWKEGNIIALIQWVPAIDTPRSQVNMPAAIFNSYKQKKPVSKSDLQVNTSEPVLSKMVQWGSMIIFDYLTGNYDRVASMQDAAMKEKRLSIIQEHIRNLRKSYRNEKLWLIDNESGLLDAYDLLYRDVISGKHFIQFHQQMLQTLCIFQKPLVDALYALKNSPKPHLMLEKYARTHEPLIDSVPKDHTHEIFQTMFSRRLKEVTDWIENCKNR